ncbi:MAG: fibronectin type III domain-containing protein [Oscillospiraceae bacterium]|nr:fibronectin type III domain-containing protein [Oscillospiraceae bacterium]
MKKSRIIAAVSALMLTATLGTSVFAEKRYSAVSAKYPWYSSYTKYYYESWDDAMAASGNNDFYVTYAYGKTSGSAQPTYTWYSSYTGLYYRTKADAVEASRHNASYVKEVTSAKTSTNYSSGSSSRSSSSYSYSSGSTKGSSANMLDAPKKITYTATPNSITLNWAEVGGADGYKVYKYNSSAKKLEEYTSVTSSSCRVTGLKANTTYIFKISPLDKVNGKYIEGKKSKQLNAKTSPLPDAPSNNFTGKVTSGGETYYFNNGKRVKGFVKTGKGYMYFDPTNYEMKKGFMFKKGLYYFNKDGIMLTNTKVEINRTMYYFGKDGRATTLPVAGKHTLLIPYIMRYGEVEEYTEDATLKTKWLVDENREEGILVYSQQVRMSDGADKEGKWLVKDLERMGYKVELYDIEEDDYLVQYQYAISKNSQYLGVMLYTTTDTLDFLDYDYPNKYEATIEISGADI